MNSATEHIATTLKNARGAKGLTQRALSGLAGLPQSHISKIESGAVDLRLTSLIELARALDLELTLVPRNSLPAVNAIVRSTAARPSRTGKQDVAARREWARLQATLNRALQDDPTNPELAQLQRVIRDLKHLRPIPIDIERLRDANKSIDLPVARRTADGLHQTLIDLKTLRNAAMHDTASASTQPVRPAYTLEEDDHGR